MSKKLFPFILVLLIASCKSAFPNEKKLSYTAEVKVGDDWKKKEASLGTADKKGNGFATYLKKGMVVYISGDGTKVTRLSFGWFRGGTHFTGEIYGIKIGDTYPKVVRLWGEPAESGTSTEDFYTKMWQFKTFGIVVDFWAAGGNDPEIGGTYEMDTVRNIQITAN
jgi:hypothetical protein